MFGIGKKKEEERLRPAAATLRLNLFRKNPAAVGAQQKKPVPAALMERWS